MNSTFYPTFLIPAMKKTRRTSLAQRKARLEVWQNRVIRKMVSEVENLLNDRSVAFGSNEREILSIVADIGSAALAKAETK